MLAAVGIEFGWKGSDSQLLSPTQKNDAIGHKDAFLVSGQVSIEMGCFVSLLCAAGYQAGLQDREQ